MTIEEFASRYLDKRDELAFRKLSGEELSDLERSMLETLNKQLEKVLPAPQPLPQNVLDAMAEVDRLARR